MKDAPQQVARSTQHAALETQHAARSTPKRPRIQNSTVGTVAVVAILWAVVVGGVALGAGYAVGVPPWNAPDEPAHYNYVRHVATTGQLPELKPGDWDAQLLERLKRDRFPRSESVDSIRYESWQPPLFYLLASPLYGAAARFPLQERVLVLRLLSVAISGVTVVLAFLAVRTIFPEDTSLQLAVAGFVAFLPQRSSIAGSVSNDALAEMVAALLLLLLLQIARNGFRRSQALLLGLTLGVALLAKMTLYGLVALAPPAAVLLAPGKGSSRGDSRPQLLGIVLIVALAMAGWWFARNAMVYGGWDIFGSLRHDQVVVGQPRLERLDSVALSYLGTTLFKSFWGQFGWMGILIDERLYFVLMLVSGLAAFGLALFLVRVVLGKGLLSPQQKASLALLGAALVVVVAQLLYYNLTFIQAQGRYLYPALLPIALFFVLGLRELLAPIHVRLLLALSVGALALLNLVCLTRYVVPYFNP